MGTGECGRRARGLKCRERSGPPDPPAPPGSDQPRFCVAATVRRTQRACLVQPRSRALVRAPGPPEVSRVRIAGRLSARRRSAGALQEGVRVGGRIERSLKYAHVSLAKTLRMVCEE